MESLTGDSDVRQLPAFLTVEEAGALLRIGRTKAYAMAKQWRATGGEAGLPVIDLGHVLRVPRRALEELVGADLSAAVLHSPADDKAVDEADKKLGSTPANPASSGPRNRSRQSRIADQLDLFDSKTKAD
jgi:hypothetical protein